MSGWASRNKDKLWVAAIGVGLALSPIHNRWLTELLTNSRGEVMFFLPAFGYLLLIMGTGMFLLHNWERVRSAGWGDRVVVTCLLVIVAAIALSGANGSGMQGKVAPLGMGAALFSLYLVCRVLGRSVFLPLAIGSGIGSLGIIAHQIWRPGETTGGFIFENNFDIATGYVLLGTALFVHRYRWLLAGLAAIALLVSGAPEAVFAIGVIGAVVVIRRDWSPRLVYVAVPIAAVVILVASAGWGRSLYSYVASSIVGRPVAAYVNPDKETVMSSPLSMRLNVIRDSLREVRPLGEGYNLTGFTVHTVHNVPLILVQQMGYPGVIAAVAWLVVSLYCLFRTRWKYAWAAVLALSVFDHFIWTQLAPLWWMLVGVSTTDTVSADLVFRRAQ